MKRNLLLLFAALLGAMSVSSCDLLNRGDMIWDIYPVEYMVRLLDSDGNDLLDPLNENRIDVYAIEATYKGKVYLVSDGIIPVTKAYMPHFGGLTISDYPRYGDKVEGAVLVFGELDGAKSYDNEELRIDWGDGTYDVVSFDRDFQWGRNGSPKVEHKWFLNGREYPDAVIEIVR